MLHVTTPDAPEAILPQMLEQDLPDDHVRTGESLSSQDWVIPLPEVCLKELDEAVQVLRRYRKPLPHLTPKAFHLMACADLMAQVRTQLKVQSGIAILDRIPVERYCLDDNRAIGWLLASLLSPGVAPTWDGPLLGEGQDAAPPLGHRVRRSVPNRHQPFHTDSPWLDPTPEVVSLCGWQPAPTGGRGRMVSLLSVHHEMRRRYPDLWVRLYQPFFWACQSDHRPDDVPYRSHPVYQYDGQHLTARYDDDSIRQGYHLADKPLDLCGEAALTILKMMLNDPQYQMEYGLEPGQLHYLNNHQFVHARRACTDASERSRPRHLIRCWDRCPDLPHIAGYHDVSSQTTSAPEPHRVRSTRCQRVKVASVRCVR